VIRSLLAGLAIALAASSAATAAAPIPAPPAVNARSWILVDHFSGRVLA
jgi:D-alanyl-D-alanine carboxypeptidase